MGRASRNCTVNNQGQYSTIPGIVGCYQYTGCEPTVSLTRFAATPTLARLKKPMFSRLSTGERRSGHEMVAKDVAIAALDEWQSMPHGS
jgi:hypothetical protein